MIITLEPNEPYRNITINFIDDDFIKLLIEKCIGHLHKKGKSITIETTFDNGKNTFYMDTFEIYNETENFIILGNYRCNYYQVSYYKNNEYHSDWQLDDEAKDITEFNIESLN